MKRPSIALAAISLMAAILFFGAMADSFATLAEFGSKVKRLTLPGRRVAKAEPARNVTARPYSLPAHLSDFSLSSGDTFSLDTLLPEDMSTSPDILDDFAFQFTVEADETAGLDINLDPGSPDTLLYAVLYDPLQRPIGAWRKKGVIHEKMAVTRGVHRLTLGAKGTLGRGHDFTLSLAGQGVPTTHGLEAGGIPALDLELSTSARLGWDFLLAVARNRLEREGGSGQPARGLPYQDVTGYIRHDNDSLSRATMGLAGAGFAGHFGKETPSLTIRIYSGPLYMGMSRFKLYSIKVKEGLLDYATGSILRDHGIFVPRWMLVNLSMNGEPRGLYVLEETPSPEFFAGAGRYDGRVVARDVETDENREFYSPPVPDGFPENLPLPADYDYTLDFAGRLDRRTFARTLAFITAFQSTHSTQRSDFRFFQHPYLYEFEPVIRDMNVDLLPARGMGLRGFLTHTSWWYGKRPVGKGAHYNPRVYPEEKKLMPYAAAPETLIFGNVHPMAARFLEEPANRELFESYLFYAADKSVRKRWEKRLASTFKATMPYLGTSHYLVRKQVMATGSGDMEVPEILPALLSSGRVLVHEQGTGVIVYNLSPFSLRLKLPGRKDAPEGVYLAPSELFPMAMGNNPGSRVEENLTTRGAEALLEIEGLRYEGSLRTASPFVFVKLPAGKREDFYRFIKNDANARWANGNSRVRASQVIRTADLPGFIESRAADIGPRDGFTISFEMKLDDESLQKTPVVFNVKDHAGQTGELKAQPTPEPGLAHLIWAWRYADDMTLPLRVNEWQHIDLAVDFRAAFINAYVNGVHIVGARLGKDKLLDKGLSDLDVLPNPEVSISGLVVARGAMPREAVERRWLEMARNDDGEKKLVIVPLDVKTGDNGRVMSYLLVNQSPHEVEFDIDMLQPTLTSNEPLTITERRVKVIGHEGQWKERGRISLRPAVFAKRLPSRLWVDGLKGLLEAPPDDAGTNAAYMEITVAGRQGHSLFYNNIPRVSKMPVIEKDTGKPVKVVVHEPFQCSLVPLEEGFKGRLPEPFDRARPGNASPLLLDAGRTKDGLRMLELASDDVVIDETLVIPEDSVLLIGPGARPRFRENAGLLVYGRLHARGTEGLPISLGPADKDGAWRGVALVRSREKNIMENVVMEKASGGAMGPHIFSGGLSVYGSDIEIRGSSFRDFTSNDALHFHRAWFVVRGSEVFGTRDDGIDADWGLGRIEDSVFSGTGGDAVDFSGSNGMVKNNVFKDIGDKAVSIGEGSHVSLKGNRITGSRIGVAVKDQSSARIEDTEFAKNGSAVAVYIKKPMYAYPSYEVTGSSFEGNEKDVVESSRGFWTDEFD